MYLSKPKTNPISIALTSLGSGRVGITPSYGQSLADAASVCLDEQGHSSPTDMAISGDNKVSAVVDWMVPSNQAKRCWNDDQYATEHGAYGIASLLIEQWGLEIIERSKKKTGFDFWLGHKGDRGDLFQGLSRLEVSGIRKGDKNDVDSRLRQKMKQTEVSDGKLSAIIVIVEFGKPTAKMVERCKK